MKRSKMREMSIEVTVGAFIFMVLLALGVFTIILSQDNFFVKNYEVRVKFEEVMGLRSGDKVFLRGVDIGKISAIDIERDWVLLTATLEKKIDFTEDYVIEILPVSVLGGKRLVINPGSSSMPSIDSGKILLGTSPKDVITEATETIVMIRNSLEEGQVLNNLAEIVADFKGVADQISSGKGTLGKLLMDDELYGELNDSLANLKTISQRLVDGKGTLGRLLSEDEKMYRDLENTVANLNDISTKLAGGEGTIGKLMQSDEMYEEFKLLLIETRAAVDDFRETSPITTFSSIFFGAF